MKKIYLLGLFWGMIGLLGGCDDNNEVFFQGEPSLHFTLSGSKLDSMYYTFTNISDNQIVVNLPVEIAGYADQDRNFRLKIIETQTTAVSGKHFEPLPETYTFKKDVFQQNIPVTIHYTGDLDSIPARLALELDPMTDFVEGIPYRQKVLIIFSNLLAPISERDWRVWYLYEFGPYSKVKHRYILSELHINQLGRGTFEDPDNWWDNFSWDEHKLYSSYMNSFFANREIYDENGNRILPWLE